MCVLKILDGWPGDIWWVSWSYLMDVIEIFIGCPEIFDGCLVDI